MEPGIERSDENLEHFGSRLRECAHEFVLMVSCPKQLTSVPQVTWDADELQVQFAVGEPSGSSASERNLNVNLGLDLEVDSDFAHLHHDVRRAYQLPPGVDMARMSHEVLGDVLYVYLPKNRELEAASTLGHWTHAASEGLGT
jgi:hypothetical protein